MKKIIAIIIILVLVFFAYQNKELILNMLGDAGVVQVNPLNQIPEEKIIDEDTPFLSLEKAESFVKSWTDWSNTDLLEVIEVMEKSESAYIYGKISAFNEGQKQSYDFYNFNYESMNEQIKQLAKDGVIDAYEASMNNIAKDSSAYLADNCFNKDYEDEYDKYTRFERPIDGRWIIGDLWIDEDGFGMNADDFYEEYKIVTKCNTPKVEKFMCCETKAMYESHVFRFVIIYNVDVTCIEGEQHNLSWFPNVGETKTVRIAMLCAYPDGVFSLQKARVLN